MGTINAALSLIAEALNADQGALNVVSNNVANASSQSYTREVPNWAGNQPININGLMIGTGVTMTGGVSQRDRVLEQRLQQQQQLSASSSSLLTALSTIESSFRPSGGPSTSGDIGSDITSFFNAYTQLESNPTSNPLRQQVLASAATLAGDIAGRAASLNGQQSSLDQSATTIVAQVNAVTASLAAINQKIQSLSPNQDAGPLEDQRQAELNQLSQLIGVNQISTEQNGLSITTTGGQLLASEGNSFQITTGAVNGLTHFFLGGADITSQIASGGGELGGIVTARDQNIPSLLSSLDQLAYGIATKVNTVNNAGTDLVGDNGNSGNIFNAPTVVSGAAMSMQVVMTDPNKIAAAGLGAGTGNNANAVVAASLATQGFIGGQTPSDFYSNLVGTLGATISETTIQGSALNASVTQLQSQRDSLSAVNLNEEASALQEFQRSYQAASQVFGILNSIMATALNLGTQTTMA